MVSASPELTCKTHGSDADLSSVGELGPEDTAGGGSKVGIVKDDGGRLSSELEGHGGQVLGAGASNDLSDHRGSSVEDVSVRVLSKRGRQSLHTSAALISSP